MQKKYFYIIALVLIIFFSACECKKSYELKSFDGYNVVMDKSFDENKNASADSVYNIYRVHAAVIMDSVIGFNNVFMDIGLSEESLLGNFAADVVASAAEEIFDTKIDVGLMNRGGLRTSLAEGNVTLGHVFSVLPFENRVSLLEVKGSDLRRLFEGFAEHRPQCVSRVKLVIKDNKLLNVLIGNELIDDNKIYKVATIDFLAEGNNNMAALKNAVSRTDSEVLIRDAMAKYIRENSPVSSKKDGRIIFEEQ